MFFLRVGGIAELYVKEQENKGLWLGDGSNEYGRRSTKGMGMAMLVRAGLVGEKNGCVGEGGGCGGG